MVGKFAATGVLVALFQIDGTLPPDLQNISPTFGPIAGGSTVTLNGANFQSGATVTFDGIAATDVAFASSTRLTARTPAHPVGPVNVAVTNPDLQSSTLTDAFTYALQPTLTSISPEVGGTLGGALFTATGTNIFTGCEVYFDTTIATNIRVVDSTTIVGLTPPHNPGTVNVVLRPPPALALSTLVGGFSYHLAPSLTSLDVSSGPISGGTEVALTGENLATGATVSFGDVPAGSVTFVSSTRLTAVTPRHDPGTVDVVVANPDGLRATLASAFTYGSRPRIDSVEPSTGPIAGGTLVSIRGASFRSGAAIQFGGAPSPATSVIDENNLLAVTPGHAEGTVDVAITNPDGQSATLAGGFSYGRVPPILIRLTPGAGPMAGGTQVTLSGGNFSSGATVTFGGALATDVTATSSTISATTPPHSPGSADVVVTNPDGQSATMPGGFVYRSDASPPMDEYVDPMSVAPKGCGTAAALPSIFGLTAALLWLLKRRQGPAER